MKCQSVNEFEKHLDRIDRDQFFSVFLLIIPGEEERKQQIDDLLIRMNIANVTKWDLSTLSMKDLLQKLHSPNLFGEKEVIVFDKIDQKSLSLLSDYIENPTPSITLILGTSSAKLSSKKMLTLDLSKEKPWEKQRRFEEWLIRTAREKEKNLALRAAQLLIEQGKDQMFLMRELEKLTAYVGDRREITTRDVTTLCKGSATSSNWQIAEKLIWMDVTPPIDPFLDTSQFLALLASVRMQLQMGEQLRYVAAGKMDRRDFEGRFPYIRSNALEKYVQVVRNRPQNFFRKAICSLFDLENIAKQGFRSPVILWEMLITHVRV